MIIPVFKPSINRKDMDSVLSCMVSDDIGPGSVSAQFVKAVSEYLGLPGGTAYREQSKALETALDVLHLDPGSRVLLSPLSPGYYIQTLLTRGFTPVYADVDPSTGCMDGPSIEQALQTFAPAASLLYHPLGAADEDEALRSAGLPVIEDITTTFGVGRDGVKAGGDAKYLVVSLEEDGIITTAGGSILLSASKNLISDFKKQNAETVRSSSMTNLNAALGVVQIRQVDAFLAKRREIREVFMKSVMKTKHRSLPAAETDDMVPYSFPVVLKAGVQNVIRYAAKHDVRVVPAFDGCAQSRYSSDDCSCPNAEALRLRCVLFPLYPRLAGQSIQLIARVLSTLP